jgi:hypothetical protein
MEILLLLEEKEENLKKEKLIKEKKQIEEGKKVKNIFICKLFKNKNINSYYIQKWIWKH